MPKPVVIILPQPVAIILPQPVAIILPQPVAITLPQPVAIILPQLVPDILPKPDLLLRTKSDPAPVKIKKIPQVLQVKSSDVVNKRKTITKIDAPIFSQYS